MYVVHFYNKDCNMKFMLTAVRFYLLTEYFS